MRIGVGIDDVAASASRRRRSADRVCRWSAPRSHVRATPVARLSSADCASSIATRASAGPSRQRCAIRLRRHAHRRAAHGFSASSIRGVVDRLLCTRIRPRRARSRRAAPERRPSLPCDAGPTPCESPSAPSLPDDPYARARLGEHRDDRQRDRQPISRPSRLRDRSSTRRPMASSATALGRSSIASLPRDRRRPSDMRGRRRRQLRAWSTSLFFLIHGIIERSFSPTCSIECSRHQPAARHAASARRRGSRG